MREGGAVIAPLAVTCKELLEELNNESCDLPVFIYIPVPSTVRDYRQELRRSRKNEKHCEVSA